METIKKIKKKFGKDLLLLAHHYQRDEIIDLADFIGDSLYLAKKSSESSAKYIVFCGVNFMAESAKILAKPKQKVFLPALEAGCPLSDSLDLPSFQKAWEKLDQAGLPEIVPITYINSSASIKAFVGEKDGTVCTSANARKAILWGLGKGKVFFVPDQHLGRNTAEAIGLKKNDIYLWNEADSFAEMKKQVRKAKLILWKGSCHVHTRFSPEHIQEFRKKHAKGLVVVHPECRKEVVDLSDGVGSTNYIIDFVEKAKEDSIIAVGTEINLVNRLYQQFQKSKTIVPLARSLCPNMYKVNLSNLQRTLEQIPTFNEIKINKTVVKKARLALGNMLKLA